MWSLSCCVVCFVVVCGCPQSGPDFGPDGTPQSGLFRCSLECPQDLQTVLANSVFDKKVFWRSRRSRSPTRPPSPCLEPRHFAFTAPSSRFVVDGVTSVTEGTRRSTSPQSSIVSSSMEDVNQLSCQCWSMWAPDSTCRTSQQCSKNHFIYFLRAHSSLKIKIVKVNKKTVSTSGPTRTRLTCAQTPGARGPVVAQSIKRARPDNETEETGQVRVNLHESLDQQGSRANDRARPPVGVTLSVLCFQDRSEYMLKQNVPPTERKVCTRKIKQHRIPTN